MKEDCCSFSISCMPLLLHSKSSMPAVTSSSIRHMFFWVLLWHADDFIVRLIFLYFNLIFGYVFLKLFREYFHERDRNYNLATQIWYLGVGIWFGAIWGYSPLSSDIWIYDLPICEYSYDVLSDYHRICYTPPSSLWCSIRSHASTLKWCYSYSVLRHSLAIFL